MLHRFPRHRGGRRGQRHADDARTAEAWLRARRSSVVGVAVLAGSLALLASGAGGVTVTSLLRLAPPGAGLNDDFRNLDLSADGACVAGDTQATNAPHPTAGSTDLNGGGADILVWDATDGLRRLTNNATRQSFEPYVDATCTTLAFSGLTGTTNSAVVLDLATGTETVLMTNAVVEDISGSGEFVVVLSTATGQMLRVRADGTGSPVAVNVDSSENPLPGSAFNAKTSFLGDLVVFQSSGPIDGSDANGIFDIGLRDVNAGTTERLSMDVPDTIGNFVPAISPNGMNVAWVRSTVSAGELAIFHDRMGGTTTTVGPSDGAISVNDTKMLGFNSPFGFDPADLNSENDAYAVNGSTLSATWLTRIPGGGGLMGGSYPFNGNVQLANDGSAAAFTTTRIVDGTDTNGAEDAVRVALGGTSPPPPTPTPPETPTPAATPPPEVELPGRADLVVTKTASKPASGESFAPGEEIVYTVEVVNAGTRDAVNVLARDTISALQLGTGAPDVTLTIEAPPECSEEQSEAIGGPVVASTMLNCGLGTIGARGGRRTITYTVRTGGDRAAMQVSNRVETFFATNDADESDNSDETTVDVDTGERECEGSSCESPPGTTTTTCAGADTVCGYGGEGVMNTVCRGEAVCGGGPERETHVCSGGAVCKDKAGEPNVFRCSGEDTYCAGVGQFTCTDGARCVANGDSSGRCEESSCSWGPGDNESVVCIESDCWLNGGDDAARCSSDSTCRYGMGDDDVTCRSGSDCLGGDGRDELDCAGEGTSCNSGRGRDDVACSDDATCAIWGTGSEVTCEDSEVDVNAPRSTTFMVDCTAEVCECPQNATSDFYVNRHSKVAARRLARPDLRLVGPGTVVTEGKTTFVQIANRKPNIVTFANATEALTTVTADERDKLPTSARTRVILDNFNDDFDAGPRGVSFDREQHPWFVPSKVHVITVEKPAAGDASFGVLRIPVQRVRPGADVGVVVVPHNVPAGFVMGGTIARTDAAIGSNGLGAGSVVVRTHLAPHVFETKGRANDASFSFDSSLTAATSSGLAGIEADDVRVDVYLFDVRSGAPITPESGACGSCTVRLDAGGRKASLSVDNIASASRAELRRLRLGYGVLAVGGRPDDVQVQGFVVNARTSAFDLSVFGAAPEEIRAPQAP